METDQYIVALEIGSSKITGAVATKSMQGDIAVVAIEQERVVDCVRYGCIQNVEETNTRINRIIKKLENRNGISPRKVKGVYVGVDARSIRNIVNCSERDLNEEIAITQNLIDDILLDAKRTQFIGYDILEVTPISYSIDKQLVKNPIGMFGSHIDAKLNLIVAKSQIKTNLKRVLDERLQLPVKGYMTTSIAVADAILTTNERQLGCMLVDFGAEVTTVSIYKNDALQYLATLPIGSRNITRDITTLKVLEEDAEEIKKTIGSAITLDSDGGKINIDGVNVSEVSNYIVARAGEIIANIIEQITYAELTADDIPEGIIMIGGGSRLNGFAELLEQQSKLKVRKGRIPDVVNVLDKKCNMNIEYIQVISLLMAGARVITDLETCCLAPEFVDSKLNEQGSSKGVVIEEKPIEVKPKKITEPKKEQKSNFGKRILDRLKTSAENMFKEDNDDEEEENK